MCIPEWIYRVKLTNLNWSFLGAKRVAQTNASSGFGALKSGIPVERTHMQETVCKSFCLQEILRHSTNVDISLRQLSTRLQPIESMLHLLCTTWNALFVCLLLIFHHTLESTNSRSTRGSFRGPANPHVYLWRLTCPAIWRIHMRLKLFFGKATNAQVVLSRVTTVPCIQVYSIFLVPVWKGGGEVESVLAVVQLVTSSRAVGKKGRYSPTMADYVHVFTSLAPSNYQKVRADALPYFQSLIQTGYASNIIWFQCRECAFPLRHRALF